MGVGGGQRGNDDMYSKSCKDKQIVAGMTYCPVDERFGVSYSTTEVCTVYCVEGQLLKYKSLLVVWRQ